MKLLMCPDSGSFVSRTKCDFHLVFARCKLANRTRSDQVLKNFCIIPDFTGQKNGNLPLGFVKSVDTFYVIINVMYQRGKKGIEVSHIKSHLNVPNLVKDLQKSLL